MQGNIVDINLWYLSEASKPSAGASWQRPAEGRLISASVQ